MLPLTVVVNTRQLTVDPAWVNLADDAKTENNDPAF